MMPYIVVDPLISYFLRIKYPPRPMSSPNKLKQTQPDQRMGNRFEQT